jgi:hypothetical protein
MPSADDPNFPTNLAIFPSTRGVVKVAVGGGSEVDEAEADEDGTSFACSALRRSMKSHRAKNMQSWMYSKTRYRNLRNRRSVRPHIYPFLSYFSTHLPHSVGPGKPPTSSQRTSPLSMSSRLLTLPYSIHPVRSSPLPPHPPPSPNEQGQSSKSVPAQDSSPSLLRLTSQRETG